MGTFTGTMLQEGVQVLRQGNAANDPYYQFVVGVLSDGRHVTCPVPKYESDRAPPRQGPDAQRVGGSTP
jgi:hypothetical protein